MSSPEPLTPERRRELTRAHLLEAAAVVFAERGYDRASLDEIARRAGFTKGAVYSNFANKEELFEALYHERQEQMLHSFFEAAAASSAEEAAARVTDVYRLLAPSAAELGLWQEFQLYARRNPALLERLRADNRVMHAHLVELVEQHWRTREVDLPLPADLLARLYVAIFDGVAQQRALDPDAAADDLFTRLVEFVDRAIVALGGGPGGG
jgi:AcrR family transcriptional regulator